MEQLQSLSATRRLSLLSNRSDVCMEMLRSIGRMKVGCSTQLMIEVSPSKTQTFDPHHLGVLLWKQDSLSINVSYNCPHSPSFMFLYIIMLLIKDLINGFPIYSCVSFMINNSN